MAEICCFFIAAVTFFEKKIGPSNCEQWFKGTFKPHSLEISTLFLQISKAKQFGRKVSVSGLTLQ